MLRIMCGHIRINIIRNHELKERLKVAPLSTKMRENKLKWFGHVKRRTIYAPVKMVKSLIMEGKRCRGRPKRTRVEQIKISLRELHLFDNLTAGL